MPTTARIRAAVRSGGSGIRPAGARRRDGFPGNRMNGGQPTTDPHAALDRGFATLARVGGAGGRPLEPDVVLAHAHEIVANNPDDAAAAIFAAVSSEGEAEAADLSWLYDEWKRRKRDEIDRRADDG
jgi:hypothetical protein